MKNLSRSIKTGILLKILSVVVLIGMLDSLAFSQTRIRFARGKSSATVKGSLYAGYERSYILGASRGQVMTVSVYAEGDIWIDIGGNDVGTGDTIELRDGRLHNYRSQ